MRYFIDTNVFLRVLVNGNQKQFKECVNLLKGVKENKIEAYTGTIVLAEISWILGSYYGFSKEKVIQGIRSVINLRGLKIVDNYNNLMTLDLYEKNSIKYIDALISSIGDIQNKNMTIISYDKDFDKLPVLRSEPKEFLIRK